MQDAKIKLVTNYFNPAPIAAIVLKQYLYKFTSKEAFYFYK